MNLRNELINELRRKDFWKFCLYMNEPFFRKRPFVENICTDIYQPLFDRKIKRASASLSPRACKSYVTSLFSAFHIGNRPELSIMRNTCTATLYDKFSYDTREMVVSEKFRALFPWVQLMRNRQNLNGWYLDWTHTLRYIEKHREHQTRFNDDQLHRMSATAQPAYFGAGVGGTIIGFGASGVAGTDDLYRGIDDALSEAISEGIDRWVEGAHATRMEKDCCELDIGTRWTLNDHIGKRMEKHYYDKSFVLPALINGKSFCDEVKTTEQYLEIQHRILPEIWNAEYMQEPIEAKGLLFQKSDLKRFKELPKDANGIELKPDLILGYVDVMDEGDDYLSAPFALVYNKAVYVTDVIYTQDTIDKTVPLIAAVDVKLKPNYIRVERNNQGGGFIRDLRRIVKPSKVLSVNTRSNKHTRILGEYGFIKEYFYFLDETMYPPGSPYDLFMQNVFAYLKNGKSKKRDAPDSIAGLSIFTQGFASHLFPTQTAEEKAKRKELEDNFTEERQ